MALTHGNADPWNRAPGFGELLTRIAQHLNLPMDLNSPEMIRGKSYPQV
jgi:hypothetical protein